MTAKTDFLENALVNHVLRNTAFTSPTTVFLGLFTAAPGETGGGTEVSVGSYIRQAITFGAPVDGLVQNSGGVTFPQATASWGLLTHFAIFDLVSAGNMLYYGTLAASKQIDLDDVIEFIAGNIAVQEL